MSSCLSRFLIPLTVPEISFWLLGIGVQASAGPDRLGDSCGKAGRQLRGQAGVRASETDLVPAPGPGLPAWPRAG